MRLACCPNARAVHKLSDKCTAPCLTSNALICMTTSASCSLDVEHQCNQGGTSHHHACSNWDQGRGLRSSYSGLLSGLQSSKRLAARVLIALVAYL